jgi:purine-binding chemotaxis protein CheW
VTEVRRYCTFQLAGESFALELGLVREVRRGAEITPVSGAPPAVSGLVNLDGKVATVLDACRALGLDARARGACLVVLGSGPELVALRVDEIGSAVELTSAEIEALPAGPEWLEGVAQHGGRSLSLVRADEILGVETR